MNSAIYWNQYVDIDIDTRKLMQDFVNRIHEFNGQDIQWPTECLVLDTDASDYAYGATLWEKGVSSGHIDIANMLPPEVVEEASVAPTGSDRGACKSVSKNPLEATT